jgi:hypothetical protein
MLAHRAAFGEADLSTFKIIRKSDYLPAPLNLAECRVTKTLGSARHIALVDMLIGKRKALRMNQTELGVLIGAQQPLISRLESGQRRVDVVEFLDLAVALRFDPVEVLVWLRQMG